MTSTAVLARALEAAHAAEEHLKAGNYDNAFAWTTLADTLANIAVAIHTCSEDDWTTAQTTTTTVFPLVTTGAQDGVS